MLTQTETGHNYMIKLVSNNKIDTYSKYRMSVQVSLNGLSFLILDQETSLVYFNQEIDFSKTHNPEEVLNEIEQAYKKHPELQTPLKEVTVIHQNTLFSLVPKALFQEDTPEDYLKLNSRLLQTDFIAHDHIATCDFVVVYVPLTNVNNYFFDLYGSFTFLHAATHYIDTILASERNGNPLKMFVKLHKNQMDILVTSGKQIQLFNSFDYSTPEDFIYYILFIAEQLQLNPETVSLQLSGKISKEDSFFDIAYTYIRHITIEKENNTNTLHIV